MKKSKLVLYLTTILSFLGVCLIYSKLPEKYPIRFDENWRVCAYGPKSSALFFGALPLIICVLHDVLRKIDPRVEQRQREKAYELIWVICIIFMIGIDWISNMFAMELLMNVTTILPVIMGLMFLVIGNYLPKVKRNSFLGVRTPWTLVNDVVWRKTHRISGYVFVVLGILSILTGVTHTTWSQTLLVIAFIVGVTFMVGYSYWCYLKETK